MQALIQNANPTNDKLFARGVINSGVVNDEWKIPTIRIVTQYKMHKPIVQRKLPARIDPMAQFMSMKINPNDVVYPPT